MLKIVILFYTILRHATSSQKLLKSYICKYIFLVCIVSFAGCIGSLRENLFFLKFYSFCLLIFFLLEMVLLALAFIYPHKLTGSKRVIVFKGKLTFVLSLNLGCLIQTSSVLTFPPKLLFLIILSYPSQSFIHSNLNGLWMQG